jgi:hypothetical protein
MILESSHTPRPLADRVFRALTLLLVFILALAFLGAGFAISLNPNHKLGNLGNALAADIFFTLGVTSFIALLASMLPRVKVFQSLADHMSRKLMILTGLLFVAFFVVLIII